MCHKRSRNGNKIRDFHGKTLVKAESSSVNYFGNRYYTIGVIVDQILSNTHTPNSKVRDVIKENIKRFITRGAIL